jgi:hypothetical protein
VTDWEPATEAETAMRDALRVADQELYFRILARTELLLPVSSDALAGRAPMGWGTWNSGGRTHVLAFTSAESIRVCLAEHAGSARKIAYHELAGAWPNHDWWLAVNPGLPIEGYLPPWFVTQLARGDVRMPGRTMGTRSRAYAAAQSDRGARHDRVGDIGAQQTYQPYDARAKTASARGAGATAAAGARRKASRATATAPRDVFTPTPPPQADEPIEAEMVDSESGSVQSSGAHSAGRSAPANGHAGGTSRRPRRHDATIIDAEIIESTVLGATALDAMIVNATVIDASTIDSDVIDATLIDMSVEDTGARAARARRSGDTRAGLTARADVAGADADSDATPRVDRATASAAADTSPTRPINVRRRAAADETQRIDPLAAAAAAADASPTRPMNVRRRAAADETQRIDPLTAAAAAADASPTRPMNLRRRAAPAETQRIDVGADSSRTRRIDVPRPGRPAAESPTPRTSATQPAPPTGTPPPAPAAPPTWTAPPAGITTNGPGAVGGGAVVDDSASVDDATVIVDASAARAARAAETSRVSEGPANAYSAARAARAPAGPDDIATGTHGAHGLAAASAAAAAAASAAEAEAEAAAARVAAAAASADAAAGSDAEAGADEMAGPASERTDEAESGTPAPQPDPAVAAFVPANETEAVLLAAATSGETEQFLSTLLLAKVLVPIPKGGSADARLDDDAFPWRREEVEGQPYLVVFTSAERMSEFLGDDTVAITAKFIQLIHVWPNVKWAFAINPGSPVGAMLPGIQIKALAAWADDVGLTDDEDFGEYDDAHVSPSAPILPVVMQKPIAAAQVDYYLDRGYDRASGFVHRAIEVMHLHTPAQLIASLGLTYSGSPFHRDATEIYLLRWAAFRPDLYRIPYGGQHEAAMRAMQGWIIERAPFRGNGFAPGEDRQVIAEFKVDSIRLPHGTQMWRLTSEGRKTLIALLDADECLWRPVRGVDSEAVWDPAIPVVPPTPSVEAAKPNAAPASRKPGTDPADDPLDPRWRGAGRRDKARSRGTGNGTPTESGARGANR